MCQIETELFQEPNLIKNIKSKYFISLGEYKFSPLIEVSSSIALRYFEEIDKHLGRNSSPLVFNFPNKNYGSLWLTIILLTNLYYEDHLRNIYEGINPKKGDRIKIFNTIAEVERVTEKNVILKFKDQSGIPINHKLRSQLSFVSKKRSLNKKQLFSTNYSKYKKERNAISKILEPNDASIVVNQENLDSTILLISGRGHANSFRVKLNETFIYDEKLSHLFKEDKNIIIKPDLEQYKNIYKKSSNNDEVKFIKWFKNLNSKGESDFFNSQISKLITLINGDKLTGDFHTKYIEFIEEYGEYKKVKYVNKLYPGLNEQLPKNLRCVIVNDLTQFETYKNTIDGFTSNGIPVIFLSNRIIEKSTDIDFYKNLFNNYPSIYRVNWNKKKIDYISKHINLDAEDNFLDKDLWISSQRYSKQKIQIQIFKKNNLDNLLPELQKQISNLDEFDNLQKAFYKFLYPAIFIIKNSNNSDNSTKKLIKEFSLEYDKVKYYGIDVKTIEVINQVLELADSFIENSKPKYNKLDNVFSNLVIEYQAEKIYIPNYANKVNIPTHNTNTIIFTGYPYQEYSGRFLMNTIDKYYVPNIMIKCWPNEGSLTYNYIKRRVRSAYFTDHLPFINFFPKDILLNNIEDIRDEVEAVLPKNDRLGMIDNNNNNIEDELNKINSFKYKGYSSTENNQSTFKVKCDIINFSDGCFMFVPKGGKILAEVEGYNGTLAIKNTKLNEMIPGLKIFKYRKDRSAYRNISRKNHRIKKSFLELEKWKEILENIYNDLDNDIYKLEELLEKTKLGINENKGNPNHINLHRWLVDDEILSPKRDNLEIILSAGNIPDMKTTLDSIYEAYGEVKSFTIRLSSMIKGSIKEKLSQEIITNSSFSISIYGVDIDVESREIISIERSDVEIDYHNTRKILC